MNCEQSQLLLHPYLDGELDVVQSLDVAEHLRQCSECDRVREQVEGLSRLLARSELRRTAPPSLVTRCQNELGRAERPPASSHSQLRWFGLIVAAAVVLVALTIAVGRSRSPRSSSDELLTQEVTTSHVRSLQVDHLVDVASSDRHTVKPWFNGKLDFATPAVDLSDRGYELVGGRLDVLDVHPVAALVYQRRQHVINLFVWPGSEAGHSPIAEETSRGFHVVHWTGGGRNCWVVSDLNPQELRDFAEQFRERSENPKG